MTWRERDSDNFIGGFLLGMVLTSLVFLALVAHR